MKKEIYVSKCLKKYIKKNSMYISEKFITSS